MKIKILAIKGEKGKILQLHFCLVYKEDRFAVAKLNKTIHINVSAIAFSVRATAKAYLIVVIVSG